jgi:peptide/nickel transport system substrate-binding protein
MMIRTAVSIILLAAAGVAGGTAPACAPDPGQDAAASRPVKGGQVVIAMQDAPTTLLEPFATTDSEIHISSLLFPTLTNLEFRGELVHVPALADRFERAADGKSVTFHLKDAAWDDGKPITAADVIFTSRLVGNAEFLSTKREYLERIASVDAIDDRTVRFQFKNAYYYPNQLSDANVGVLPEHIYKDLKPAEARGTERAFRPVGHGPFRVLSHEGQSLVVLERNPKVATDRVPWLKRVVFYHIPSADGMRNALLAGEVDAIDTSRLDHVEEILSKGGYRVTMRGQRWIDFVAWNIKNPLLADRDVRRALTMAIDRAGMNSVVFKSAPPGSYSEPVGSVPPALEGAIAKELHPLPFDRAEALKILGRAGWKRGTGGTLEKDGRKFLLKLSVNKETPRRAQTAAMIQQDLREIGVDVEIDAMSFDALRQRAGSREFDAMIFGFGASLQLKQGEVWGTGAPYNLSNYSNPEVDRIVGAVRDEVDPGKIRELLKTLQKIVYDDQPVTFLCWFTRYTVARDCYRDFGASILAPIGDLPGCYVPLKLQKQFVGE